MSGIFEVQAHECAPLAANQLRKSSDELAFKSNRQPTVPNMNRDDGRSRALEFTGRAAERGLEPGALMTIQSASLDARTRKGRFDYRLRAFCS